MALATYADLQAAVADHLHRSDLTVVIPDLITLAEHNIYSDLNSRQQDALTTLSTVAGTETVSLPSDFINARTLTVTGTSPNVPLEYRTPDQYEKEFPYDETGTPRVYTIIGSSLYLAPTPDAVYSIRLVYQQKLPALSGGSNWLMTQFPAVYLYATLLAAAPYLNNDERITVWQQLYAKAMDGVNKQDWSSMATMRVKSDVRL